jgi:hypothetical protein
MNKKKLKFYKFIKNLTLLFVNFKKKLYFNLIFLKNILHIKIEKLLNFKTIDKIAIYYNIKKWNFIIWYKKTLDPYITLDKLLYLYFTGIWLKDIWDSFKSIFEFISAYWKILLKTIIYLLIFLKIYSYLNEVIGLDIELEHFPPYIFETITNLIQYLSEYIDEIIKIFIKLYILKINPQNETLADELDDWQILYTQPYTPNIWLDELDSEYDNNFHPFIYGQIFRAIQIIKHIFINYMLFEYILFENFYFFEWLKNYFYYSYLKELILILKEIPDNNTYYLNIQNYILEYLFFFFLF